MVRSSTKWIIVFTVLETLVLAFFFVGHHLKKKGVLCGITTPAFTYIGKNNSRINRMFMKANKTVYSWLI